MKVERNGYEHTNLDYAFFSKVVHEIIWFWFTFNKILSFEQKMNPNSHGVRVRKLVLKRMYHNRNEKNIESSGEKTLEHYGKGVWFTHRLIKWLWKGKWANLICWVKWNIQWMRKNVATVLLIKICFDRN